MIEISIVIPTYNRAAWLAELLDSIAGQTMMPDRFEVIIVDDGSHDETPEVAAGVYPFSVRYFHQPNQGDAAARNLGAGQSEAEYLLFLDDDIILAPGYVERIHAVIDQQPRSIVVGNDLLWLREDNPLEAGAAQPERTAASAAAIPFAEVCSNNMMVRRENYFEFGMMQGLGFPGSSMWCDVDFAYRAHRAGCVFLRSAAAICWHRDHVLSSLESHARRMEEVAYRAVTLFRKYPELVGHLPMFDDMLPVRFGQDSPLRVLRKMLRAVSASGPVLSLMRRLHTLLREKPAGRSLRKWIVGANIYRGYRRGLRAA